MIDPQANPKSYLRLMALVILLGLISAVVTFAFMALVHQGTSADLDRSRAGAGYCSAAVYLTGLYLRRFVGRAAGKVLRRS